MTKKKSPPKKLKTPPPPPTIKMETTQVLEIPPLQTAMKVGGAGTKKQAHHFKLRLEAQAVFLADMNGCSIEDVHNDPRFKDVSIQKMKVWANEDDWMGKRKITFNNLQKRLTEEIGSKLTDRMYFEVQSLLKMLDQAHNLLQAEATKPRSWEGVNDQVLKMNKRLSEIYKMVTEGVIDDAGKAIDKAQVTKAQTRIPYDAATLQEISKLFTTRKREELRARIEAAKTPEQKEMDHDSAPAQGPTPGPIEPSAPDVTDVPIPTLASPLGPNSSGNHGNGA